MKQKTINLELNFEEPRETEYSEAELQTLINSTIRFFQLCWEDLNRRKLEQVRKENQN